LLRRVVSFMILKSKAFKEILIKSRFADELEH